MTREFRAGDIVNYYPYGDREFILEKSDNKNYPLCLKEIPNILFQLDGRQWQEHVNSSITLVKSAKRTEKITVYTHEYYTVSSGEKIYHKIETFKTLSELNLPGWCNHISTTQREIEIEVE